MVISIENSVKKTIEVNFLNNYKEIIDLSLYTGRYLLEGFPEPLDRFCDFGACYIDGEGENRLSIGFGDHKLPITFEKFETRDGVTYAMFSSNVEFQLDADNRANKVHFIGYEWYIYRS